MLNGIFYINFIYIYVVLYHASIYMASNHWYITCLWSMPYPVVMVIAIFNSYFHYHIVLLWALTFPVSMVIVISYSNGPYTCTLYLYSDDNTMPIWLLQYPVPISTTISLCNAISRVTAIASGHSHIVPYPVPIVTAISCTYSHYHILDI